MDVEEMKEFLRKRRFKAWLIANGRWLVAKTK